LSALCFLYFVSGLCFLFFSFFVVRYSTGLINRTCPICQVCALFVSRAVAKFYLIFFSSILSIAVKCALAVLLFGPHRYEHGNVQNSVGGYETIILLCRKIKQ